MNHYNIQRSPVLMESALKQLKGNLEAVLNGKCQLTTNPALRDPVSKVWDIEHNLLRYLLCRTLDGLGEKIPPENNYKGVKYYVEETERIL